METERCSFPPVAIQGKLFEHAAGTAADILFYTTDDRVCDNNFVCEDQKVNTNHTHMNRRHDKEEGMHIRDNIHIKVYLFAGQ